MSAAASRLAKISPPSAARRRRAPAPESAAATFSRGERIAAEDLEAGMSFVN
jgi:hypothetical protein